MMLIALIIVSAVAAILLGVVLYGLYLLSHLMDGW